MRRIMVVDDDLHVECAVGVSLKHRGFRVSIADSEPAVDEGDLALITRLGVIDERLRETEPDRWPLAALAAVAGAQAAVVISNRMAVQALVRRRWNAPQPE